MKYSIVKYGGLRAYRQARPVFLGLVLGEMTCAGIWAIIGVITGVSRGHGSRWTKSVDLNLAKLSNVVYDWALEIFIISNYMKSDNISYQTKINDFPESHSEESSIHAVC